MLPILPSSEAENTITQSLNITFFMTTTLLSHTDRTLAEHLHGCNQISKTLLAQKNLTTHFFDYNTLEQMRLAIVFFHDLGKATDFFQHRIITAIEQETPDKPKIAQFAGLHQPYINHFNNHKANNAQTLLLQNHDLGRHAALGSYCVLTNYAHQADTILELIVLQTIKKHHGDLPNYTAEEFTLAEDHLSNYHQQLTHLNFDAYNHILQPFGFAINYDQFDDITQQFKNSLKLNRRLKTLQEQKTLKYFFLQQFIYSLLLSADKGDVMVDNKLIIQPNRSIPLGLVDAYKKIKFGDIVTKNIDIDRETAYQHIAKNVVTYANNNFFSITLPTGMGKTFSAYNAAFLLQNALLQTQSSTQAPYRIVYCLPFTSIIDQNEQILSDIFAENGLSTNFIAKNHYLADLKTEYIDQELTYSEAEYLTEGWEQEVVVTTFVQLLESIFTNRNKSLRKFHNITNAIVLLDEVQNVPPKYYPLIEQTFKAMALYFNTKFVFITATQPIIFTNPEDIIELTDPSKTLTKHYFTKQERIVLDVSLWKQGELKLADFVEHLDADITQNPDKSFLIICNTLKQSQDIFKALKHFRDTLFYYLSSSILPCFRKQIINQIKYNTANNIRQIIVSTQVVEAGVDIDLDIVYRDFASLDSINQSAGRCNRNGVKGQGVVKLFNLGKASRIYDATLLDITREVLNQQQSEIIAESNFYNLNNAYFKLVKQRVQDDNDVSKNMLVYMQQLKFKELASNFKVIENTFKSYDVFIPIDEAAKQVWAKYEQTNTIANVFERKRALKQLKPQLMQYVTRFPAYGYEPSHSQKDKGIIYVEDWQLYYSKELGFQKPNEDAAMFA